ncbi:DUF4251 domain-containing protein [Bacteroides caecigallinarum]|uniref:DUF4251 domain-containing protein n=1 Tax=Bacteroides caecigallinarum TaxID=1411144 RepID=UPI0019596C8A|nr:DUF4251 domain-containing protein [Bacteroides caecigallinarum]MBM6888826.1 DUF4251 domain-containing protein [Bacteroides caecigallinarum]MCF2551838.1 DUF4251 domain-containing protein [Bacteroides caecigallinarum]
MRIIISLFMLLTLMAGNVHAQEFEKLTGAERKAIQEKLDSLMYVEAEKAISDKDFTLEADKVEFKYGQTAFVNSNTNFVSVTGDKSVVQVAFNVPVSGPNGIGGITLDGNISNYEVKKDKKGNINVSMNVMGTGISALVNISLYSGSNKASVTITPNFNSNRLTLTGVIVPSSSSRVFKGRSI